MMRPVQVASVGFTSLLGALLGYDIGIISGAIIFIRDDLGLSTRQAEVVVGSLNLVRVANVDLLGDGVIGCDRGVHGGHKRVVCMAM